MFYDDPNISKVKEEGVWLGKGFVSLEDCSEIMAHVDAFEEKDWLDGWARHQGTLFYTNEASSEKPIAEWWSDKVSPPVLIPAVTKINAKLKGLFSPDYVFLPEYKIVRLKPGHNMKSHRDNRSGDNDLDVETKQEFTIQCAYTIYLSDFKGGEINYPELGYTHTPEPGDIVIHSGRVLHEVFDVLEGNRYTITGWLLGK
jgi:predicted 2-oxoglutarate/Fe(II)-dependent dioxygenase YbiX